VGHADGLEGVGDSWGNPKISKRRQDGLASFAFTRPGSAVSGQSAGMSWHGLAGSAAGAEVTVSEE
jgi:hypothetical protein